MYKLSMDTDEAYTDTTAFRTRIILEDLHTEMDSYLPDEEVELPSSYLPDED